MIRHFLKDTDLSPAEQLSVLDLAAQMKESPYLYQPYAAEGAGRKTVAVIFDKTSTRTRLSFATGVADLGGVPLIINPGESQMGHKESISDTVKVLERMVSTVVWRTYAHSGLEEMAAVDGVTEVRGAGLLIGFDLDADVAPAAVTAALDAGFIINSPGPRTIRLAPPLILTTEQADRFLAALPAILQTAKDAQ